MDVKPQHFNRIPAHMTKLHIRKNLSSVLRSTAQAVENLKAPDMSRASEKVHEYRIRLAALVMPNDCAFTIDPSKINH